jgi:RNA polymerase sigma-70 factor (ECF subfamily)
MLNDWILDEAPYLTRHGSHRANGRLKHLGESDAVVEAQAVDRHEYTDIGGPAGTFRTTHWSLIENAHSNDPDTNRLLIGLLLQRYWKPVYCYLRHKSYNNDQAKDLTQGFFHEAVLGRHLIDKADPAKGRFRSFLLMALDRYLTNVHRAESAQKRIPPSRLVPLDVVEPLELPTVVSEMSAEAVYDYVWVSTLLQQVVEEVKADCCKDGMTQHWNVFHDRVLAPIVQQSNPPSLSEICTSYDIAEERQASNMIITMKRRLQAALANRLRETVTSEEELTGEMDEIRRFFLMAAQERR